MKFIHIICAFSGLLAVIGCYKTQSSTADLANHNLIPAIHDEVSFISSVNNLRPCPWKFRLDKVNSQESLMSIQAKDSMLWTLDAAGVVFITSNRGKTWEKVRIDKPADGKIMSVFFINRMLGWAIVLDGPSDVLAPDSYSGTVLNTADGGLSWQAQYAARAIEPTRVLFINEHEGWIIGNGVQKRDTLTRDFFVLHTIDGGNLWVDVSPSSNPDFVGEGGRDIYAVEPNHALVLTAGRKLFSTSDGGNNWRQQEAIKDEPPQTGLNRLGLLSSKLPWVLGGTGGREGSWTTLAVNRGEGTWVKFRLNNINLSDAVFTSDKEVIACGTFMPEQGISLDENNNRVGVILYSSDQGRNWSIIHRNTLSKTINALAAVDSNHIWAVGEDGLIIHLHCSAQNELAFADK